MRWPWDRQRGIVTFDDDPAFATTRREGDHDFPRAAYYYTPSGNPMTWKLRGWADPEQKETAAQVTAACKSLSDVPADDRPAVARTLRAAWKRTHPDAPDSDMPASIALSATEHGAATLEVAFTGGAPVAVADGFVVRRGKIFEAGDYPDKDFAISPEELETAARLFTPVALDLSHTPTVLDGKLGQLTAVETSDDGRTLFGLVRLPQWLDAQLDAGERKVSATFDRVTKRIIGLALVPNPRVSDAVLLAAFAQADASQGADHGPAFAKDDKRHNTMPGQSALQQLHDVAAMSGATCNPDNAGGKRGGMAMPFSADETIALSLAVARFHSRHESEGLQAVHDLTTEHGAACMSLENDPPRDVMQRFERAPAARNAGAADFTVREEDKHVNLRELLARAKAAGLGEDASLEQILAAEARGATVGMSDREREAETRAADAERRARAAQEKADQMQMVAFQADADAYVSELLHAGKIVPAERQSLKNLLIQASVDDYVHGVVKFHDEDGTAHTVTRVERVKEPYEKRPEHMLTEEDIKPGLRGVVLYNRSQTPGAEGKPREGVPASQERVDQMLAMTGMGQRVIAERSKNGSGH